MTGSVASCFHDRNYTMDYSTQIRVMVLQLPLSGKHLIIWMNKRSFFLTEAKALPQSIN
jgi:hypothetical protein